MPIGFALCHGWALGKESVAALQSLLAQYFPSSEFVIFNLGFWGPAECPPLSPDRKWVAVGHSYGFSYLMQQDVEWAAAIAINGFLHFCRGNDQQVGVPVRVIDAMLAGLASDHRRVVRAFYEQCGENGAVPETLNPRLLIDHLQRLRDIDLPSPSCRTLAMLTEGDAVVSQSLVRACFSAPQCVTLSFPGNHMTLINHPAAIVPLISEFVKDCHA